MRTWVIALGIALVSTSFALAGKQLPFYVENGSREQTLRLKHVLHLGIQQENLFRRLDLDEKDSFVVDYLSEDEEVKNFDILSIEQTSGNLKAVKKPFVRPTTKSQQWGKLTVPKAVKWDEEEIWVPDMEDKETVLTLAKMTYNTYLAPKTSSWYDLGERWQTNSSFGWEKDGLRGHVFGNEDNSTLVIAFKGTTAAFLWMGDGETSTQDKLNDNLLFSCCCGRVDPTWTPVCGCFTGSNTCNQTCVEESLSGRSLYYQAAMKLFYEVTDMYPASEIWFTGHSLGGSVGALIGLTFGIPTVTFEAPGELMAAKRLHLPMPPGVDMSKVPIWHIGHNADPLYTGSCTGITSSCYFGGYAMESKCHTGTACVYDVISKFKWKQDIRSHRIETVIEKVLKPWDDVANCEVEKDCVDCGLWRYRD